MPDVSDAYAAILADARREVAAGRPLDVDALAARIHAATPKDERRARDALRQLDRVATVARARAALSRPAPAPAVPAARPAARTLLRTRPTINANMDVRRERRGDTFVLAWDTAPGVTAWEVRISERPNPRADYAVTETLELPGSATSYELPLGDRTLRVHLLGRGRGEKLVRRAVMSGLTRDGWGDRWQRRASAA